MNWFNIIIILGIVQGLLLSVAIFKQKKGNKKSKRILSLYIIVIVVTLMGRFFYNYNPASITTMKLIFIGDLLIFLYGPLLYFYLKSIFEVKEEKLVKVLSHFIPLLIFILIMTPLAIVGREKSIELIKFFSINFKYIEVLAILQNIFYLFLNLFLLDKYLKMYNNFSSELPKIKFYKIILYVHALSLLCWIFSLLVVFFKIGGANDYFAYQLIWISLSITVLGLGYYSVSNPEALNSVEIQRNSNPLENCNENLEEYAKKLQKLMLTDKPYLTPKLSISDLSELTGINTHLLSKVINTKFNKNFFDYINSYRVEEFKKEVAEKESMNLTFLGIAYKVGFNSKTTFNTAFKKIENKTPKQYLETIN